MLELKFSGTSINVNVFAKRKHRLNGILKKTCSFVEFGKKKCCFNKSWIVDRELVTKSDGAVSLVICKGQIFGLHALLWILRPINGEGTIPT